MGVKIALGGIAVEEVQELVNPNADPFGLFTPLDRATLDRHASWLAPHYWNPDAGTFPIVIRSWLLKTAEHTILIDTCCGNDKPRTFPPADRLSEPYLDRLAAAGVRPEEVDFVMCTHLHVDHCGWNTRLDGGRWVPTFPNARDVISQAEYEAWARAADDPARPQIIVGEPAIFADSVSPVVEAGLAELVDGRFSPAPGITIEPAVGHSPGHSLIRAESRGVTGLFVGDAMHHPIQIAEPEVCTRFDTDPAAAEATRLRIMRECAEHGHWLIPAHFADPALGRIEAQGDGFAFRPGMP
jgi:glyoxylase-like metal-dependent hydrolase (beta-lactamase superfamily II)